MKFAILAYSSCVPVLKGMRNSPKNLHVTLFSCLVKLSYSNFCTFIIIFSCYLMATKDEYCMQSHGKNEDVIDASHKSQLKFE